MHLTHECLAATVTQHFGTGMNVRWIALALACTVKGIKKGEQQEQNYTETQALRTYTSPRTFFPQKNETTARLLRFLKRSENAIALSKNL